MAPAGEVTAVRDEGTIWQMFYKIDDNGLGVVNFDWRMLAQMHESESGRSFWEDYEFGDGVAIIQEYFIGRRIRVEGDAFDETVFLEDSSERSFRPTPILQTPEDYLRRYPRITASIICESLGYATPTKAAIILRCTLIAASRTTANGLTRATGETRGGQFRTPSDIAMVIAVTWRTSI